MTSTGLQRIVVIACLVFASEMIFSLPFHVARYFRPTVLAVFDLSNAALGDIFAVYGITAMLAYFPGGLMADLFSARKLMAASLLATALGGLYMATIPNQWGMSLLFAYWGVTSILLFWAAMIKATREWGGQSTQGSAFGLLDGGRGLAAACVASLAVYLFGILLPEAQQTDINAIQRGHALRQVIYFYSFMTCLAAVLVWFFIPDTPSGRLGAGAGTDIRVLRSVSAVLRQRRVWLQAMIVVCAYCGYKGLDNYALYATDVLNMNEVSAARFTATAAYLRPVAAIAAGFCADRFLSSKVIAGSFMILLVSYALLALLKPDGVVPGAMAVIYANIIVTFCAVFAVRGVYFALLEESKVPNAMTGTAVGLISVIGFTPDVFFASLAGRLLDASHGVSGHQHLFMLLAVFACIGMFATLLLTKHIHRPAGAIKNEKQPC